MNLTRRPLIRVRVPASTSNLGSGFDTISAALGLYLTVDVEPGEGNEVQWVKGWELSSKENILEQALRATFAKSNRKIPGLRLSMENPIPLQRGLGSSGAAVIAGILIADAVGGLGLSGAQVLELAYPLEGHPDNISASLLGGWVLSWLVEGRMHAEKIRSALNCRFVVAIPEVIVSTRQARAILPSNYSRSDTVYNLQRCALLVHALHTGEGKLLGEAIQDRLHQPYRSRLVPGLNDLLERKNLPADLGQGILGLSISGSGSSAVALTAGPSEEVGSWMVQTLARAGTRAVWRALDLDLEGARIIRP